MALFNGLLEPSVRILVRQRFGVTVLVLLAVVKKRIIQSAGMHLSNAASRLINCGTLLSGRAHGVRLVLYGCRASLPHLRLIETSIHTYIRMRMRKTLTFRLVMVARVVSLSRTHRRCRSFFWRHQPVGCGPPTTRRWAVCV